VNTRTNVAMFPANCAGKFITCCHTKFLEPSSSSYRYIAKHTTQMGCLGLLVCSFFLTVIFIKTCKDINALYHHTQVRTLRSKALSQPSPNWMFQGHRRTPSPYPYRAAQSQRYSVASFSTLRSELSSLTWTPLFVLQRSTILL
jgi:hypothetical protein